MNSDLSSSSRWSWRRISAVALIVVGLLVEGFLLYDLWQQGHISYSAPLQLKLASDLGDLFGGLATVFWTLAAVLLLYETLILQRSEFDATRETLRLSQFENTFFNMVDHLTRIIEFVSGNTPKPGGGTNHYKGWEYFHAAFKHFCDLHEKLVNPELQKQSTEQILDAKTKEMPQGFLFDHESLRPLLLEAYEKFYNDHEENLGHYFRYLYNIFKYVDASSLSADLKRKYIDILQARSSNDELGLLFYNALSVHAQTSEGKPKFQEWLDQYQFLENIDKRCIIVTEYSNFYPRTKFKGLSR